ncbi:hypothetical protein LUZ60_006086 [Juncus effusus]|nr:hypothetical protein LUZ60_006086 [Juncus effusus]
MSLQEEANENLLQVEEENLHKDITPYTSDGSIDFKGRRALKHQTGNWRASSFILITELGVSLSYFAISRNLVVYLKNELHEESVVAAAHVSAWQGTYFLATLVGAYVADSHWGNYLTITCFCSVFSIGMIVLTLSTFELSPQYIFSFVGIYMVALGGGAMKPCLSAFGANQFDGTNPMAKGSFFSWYYMCIKIGNLIAVLIIVPLQDIYGWPLEFGIPAFLLLLGLLSFLIGTKFYRYHKHGGSALIRLCQVAVAAMRKRNLDLPKDNSLLYEATGKHNPKLRCLDKAAIVSDSDFPSISTNTSNPWMICTVSQIEESKVILCLLPV